MRRIFKNSSIYGLGTVLPQIIGLLLLPIYTSYLNPEDYGLVDMCTTITLLILMIFKMGIPGSISRLYFDYIDDLEVYISTIFWFFILTGILLSIIALMSGNFIISKFIVDFPFTPFFYLIIITAFVRVFTIMQRQIIMAREQASYSAKLSIFTAAGTISLVFYFVVVMDMKALGFVLGGAIGSTLVFIQVLYYFRKEIKFKFNLSYLIPSLIWGISMFPSHFLNVFAPFISKTILVDYESMTALGHISIATRITSPLFIFLTAFNKAYLPIYYSYREKKKSYNELMRISQNIWLFGCFLFLTTILLSPALIKILTPDSYHPATELIGIISLGFLFNIIWVLFGREIFYKKYTYIHPLISFFAVSSNLGFVFIYIKSLGMYAVAIGMTIYWAVFAISGIIIFNYFKVFNINEKYYIQTFIITCIFSSIYWLFKFYSLNQFINLFLGSLIIVIYILVLKNKYGVRLDNVIETIKV